MSLTIRDAKPGDGEQLFAFIHELAVYEKLSHEVVASPAVIEDCLQRADARVHAILAERDGVAVGMAVYFYNFSTFLGRHGLYIEDLYVQPRARKLGVGQQMLHFLAAKAVAQGCGRMEWSVLDWNHPAINFYERLGARAMREWQIYRLEGAALELLAEPRPLALAV